MKCVHAVYEKGVFRPTEPVDLPEGLKVEVWTPESPLGDSEATPMDEGLARIYQILGRRYASGHLDTAERHNEHQP